VHGAKVLYENGLPVRTTLDATLQDAAKWRSSAAAPRRQAPRLPEAEAHVLAERHTTTGSDERWNRLRPATPFLPSSSPRRRPGRPAGSAPRDMGKRATSGRAALAADLFKAGDLIEVGVGKLTKLPARRR
jgi:hypothetical protein